MSDDNRTPVDRVKAYLIGSDRFRSVLEIGDATGLTNGQVNQIVYDLKGMGLVVMVRRRGVPLFSWHQM